MKPLDPATVPAHLRYKAGKTGLVHGLAPILTRKYQRAAARANRGGRKGAKAQARAERELLRRFGTTRVRFDL